MSPLGTAHAEHLLRISDLRAGASLIELGVGCLAPATPSADVV